MATRIDMRCGMCGDEREFVFESTPPYVHRKWHVNPQTGKPCEGGAGYIRQWGPVAIGRVPGAGGSPAR